VKIGTVDIDAAIRELTNVRTAETTTAFVFGRQKWMGPTLHKPAEIWEIWQPYAVKPKETIATFMKGSIKKERDGDSPDFLLEVPLAHIRVLELEDFVLSDEYVARIRERIRQQRRF
jgi:hypothetical protein